MKQININTEELNANIEMLKLKNEKVKEIFSNIEQRMNQSQDYWQSSTSELIMEEFRMLYSEFSKIKESNDKYISFLQNIVSTDYINKEDSLNDIIDNNI